MDGPQTCELCSWRLPSILHLNAHQVRKHLLCLICPFQASSKDTLFQHFTETKHRYPCHVCGIIFATTERLTAHDCTPKQVTRSAVPREDLNSCSTCIKTFASVDDLKKHKIVAHLICVKCEFKAQTDYDLVEHFILTEHRNYCHACGTVYETVKELDDHECKPMVLECGKCNMIAPHPEALDRHRVNCTTTKLVCQTCKMVAPDGATYNKHVADCKPGKETCPVCGLVAPDWTAYIQHWTDTLYDTRHSAISTCKGCNENFRSMTQRDTHLELVFGCRVCHTHNSDNNALLLHMQTYHGDNRNIKCIWCHLTFDHFSKMLYHVERGRCQNMNRNIIDAAMAAQPADQSCMYGVDAEHYNSHGFVSHDHRVFYCKGCDRGFRYLSGLFSHTAMSTACPQKMTGPHIKGIMRILRGR